MGLSELGGLGCVSGTGRPRGLGLQPRLEHKPLWHLTDLSLLPPRLTLYLLPHHVHSALPVCGLRLINLRQSLAFKPSPLRLLLTPVHHALRNAGTCLPFGWSIRALFQSRNRALAQSFRTPLSPLVSLLTPPPLSPLVSLVLPAMPPSSPSPPFCVACGKLPNARA